MLSPTHRVRVGATHCEVMMRAYDIEMLTRPVDRADSADHGWCFGLPPGITPEQWPLDSNNGYPLVHGFTILLPEDYRCHGPDIVALSFFTTPCDMNNGHPFHDPQIEAAFQLDAEEPADANLAAFWQSARRGHPRLTRMQDSLGLSHATILLTINDYVGPLCHTPALKPNLHRDRFKPPEWIKNGAAATFWKQEFSPGGMPAERYGVFRELGGIPVADITYNRAIRYIPRRADPNAGVPPCDIFDDGEPTGYQQYAGYVGDDELTKTWRVHEWSLDHQPDHIGGTMRPCQFVPRYSPYYIEFGETFGGYNFGGGNAQLDFKDMKFDWACG